jgi:hypothetical protein
MHHSKITVVGRDTQARSYVWTTNRLVSCTARLTVDFPFTMQCYGRLRLPVETASKVTCVPQARTRAILCDQIEISYNLYFVTEFNYKACQTSSSSDQLLSLHTYVKRSVTVQFLIFSIFHYFYPSRTASYICWQILTLDSSCDAVKCKDLPSPGLPRRYCWSCVYNCVCAAFFSTQHRRKPIFNWVYAAFMLRLCWVGKTQHRRSIDAIVKAP